jgi:type III secretion protein V
MAQPKAIAIAAGLLVLLAIVPGLPAVPFLTLAAVLGLVAWRLLRAPVAAPGEATPAAASATSAARAQPGAGADAVPPPVLTPIAVEVGAEIGALLGPKAPADVGAFATDVVPRLRERMFAELGLPVPVVRLRPAVTGLGPTAFVVRINEVPLARGDIARDGLADAAARLGDELAAVVRRYGHELFGLEETQGLLDALERTHPALVREVVPKLISPVLLTDVLRRLVEEGISLRNLRDILGALAEWAPQDRDPVALTEHVRVALRRAITYKHAGDAGVLAAYLLDPMIEDAIRESIQKTPTGSYLALEPQISRDIVAAVGRALGPDGAASAVLLTGVEIRRYVRRLVEGAHPGLAVLSYQELAPEAQIRPIARISIAGTA